MAIPDLPDLPDLDLVACPIRVTAGGYTLGSVANRPSVWALPFFFFYSADRDEPPHVRAEREDFGATFWLDPVCLESSRGFGRAEIRRIERLVEENRELLLRSWHEYFGD